MVREGSAPGGGTNDVEDWVRAAAAGDQAGWEHLVDRFGGLLWSICRGYRLSSADAADAFQLTWLRLLERLDSIEEPSRVGAWLATTCRRECLATLRKGSRTTPVGDEALTRLVGAAAPADVPTLVAERDAILWRAFSGLTERCQQVLRVLVADADRHPPRYAAAAAALEMPVGSLGPTRSRCLDQLRKLLDMMGI